MRTKARKYMTGKTGFTMIPNEIIFADITPQAKALFAVLSSYADNDGSRVWPSRKTMADAMGMAMPKSVDKYLKELEREGFIERQFRPNQSTLYEVARWSKEAASCRLSSRGSTPQGTTPGTPQGTTQYPTGDTPQYPTGDTIYTHSPIPNNQTHLLPISSGNFGDDWFDAPRRGGQPPAEETRAVTCEEQEIEMVEPVASIEGKDSGDGIELGPLMQIAPDWLSDVQQAALKSKSFGWSPDAKRWVVLPFP